MTANSETDFRIDPAPLGPISGDHNDDDGRAIDEAFEAADWGPQAYGGVKVDREDLPPVTRLITVMMDVPPIANGGVPIMFFPPDRNRVCMILDGDNAGWNYGSDPNELAALTRLNAGGSIGSSSPLIIAGHTGAIWISTPVSTATVSVTVITS